MPQDYTLPSIELLATGADGARDAAKDREQPGKNLALIVKAMTDAGLTVETSEFAIGAAFTRYEIYTEEELTAGQVSDLNKHLSKALHAKKISILAPIPGSDATGIDVPNATTTPVFLRTLLETPEWNQTAAKIPMALGQDVHGRTLIADLRAMPHVLIAGEAGSGKSNGLHAMLLGFLLNSTPEELHLVLIDTKGTEFRAFEGLRQAQVFTGAHESLPAFRWLRNEVKKRTNQSRAKAALPHLVVVIDEIDGLTETSLTELKALLVELAAKGESPGIHLIATTAKPQSERLSPDLLAAFPSRIAFKVESGEDSTAILNETGAENLCGHGDCLFYFSKMGFATRIQGGLISEQDITQVTSFAREQGELLTADDTSYAGIEPHKDDTQMVLNCVDLLRKERKASKPSATLFQARLKLSAPDAAYVIAYLEMVGVLGPEEENGEHTILVGNTRIIKLVRSGAGRIAKKVATLSVSPDDGILAELDQLVGLRLVKAELRQTAMATRAMMKRRAAGHYVEAPSYHSVFTGAPGTGKTTVARLMGRIYAALGILKKGHVVDASRALLVSENIGGTAILTRKKLEAALDGVLFIDEAYTLSQSTSPSDTGYEAINEILAFMENHRDRLIIIVAGYEERMIHFIKSNPGLQSRFDRFLKFEDFNPAELAAVFDGFCRKSSYGMTHDFKLALLVACHEAYANRNEQFANARWVRSLFLNSQAKFLARTHDEPGNPPLEIEDLAYDDLARIEDILDGEPPFAVFCPNCRREHAWTPDLPTLITCEKCKRDFDPGWGLMKNSDAYRAQTRKDPAKPVLSELLAELEGLTGLAAIKGRIKELINSIRVEQEKLRRGLPSDVPINLHMTFSGAPGTGKTTVARLVGQIFRALGVLAKGHFVEVDRAKLVGSYIGHTEANTARCLDEAMDGVFFIDEAYSLTNQDSQKNDFGPLAVATILKRMEDARNRLIVIAAGYPAEIQQFVKSNPGLESRFAVHLFFDDYGPEELMEIISYRAASFKMVLEEALQKKVRKFFEQRFKDRDKNFSNARLARNLFESIYLRQTSRISDNVEKLDDEEFQILRAADWPDDETLGRIR